jgi:DNA polymerase
MLNISDCKKCALHKNRHQVVVGEGNYEANIVLVGECPGPDEDKQGKPFIGRSGRLLRDILYSLGVEQGDIYITNIVKCFPYNSLNPSPEHIKACSEYLEQQLREINPKLIVTLGRHSSEYFIGKSIKITKESGKMRTFEGKPNLLPILHPSYVLRGNMKPADYAMAFLPMLGYCNGNENR